MPISFAQIPANWRMPLYWVEVDSSKAGLPISRQAALLVGTKLAAGVATVNVPRPIGTQAQADHQYGEGSELSLMFKAFFANNFAHEVWGAPVAEPPGGTQATATITVAAEPTEAGTINLYIAGRHVPVTIGATDSDVEIAAAITEAVNADPTLPVTAYAAGTNDAIVHLVCKWKGINGNDISMRDSYYGRIGGEELPVGLRLTYSGSGRMTGGAGVPVFDDVISAMGEQEFEYVALPFTDSTTLLAFETEYGFSDTGRWGFMRQHFGHLFAAKRASYADLIAFGATRNSPVTSIMGFELDTPSPMFMAAAAYTAKAARSLTNDPARPLQTLGLHGLLPAASENRFIISETNNLAGAGIATQHAGNEGVPMILRETTTYQLNLYGQSDDAYELVTTPATLARLLRDQRQAITSKYPRHKLANDGTRFGVGQAIVTPKIIKAELVAQYRIAEFNGLVEDVSNFKKHLIVERDSNNANRVNVLYPPDLVNGMRVFAVLAQFRLQFDRGIDTEIAAA